MKPYTKVDVLEQQLEDLIRRNPELIDKGLVYLDHQKTAAGGRLDVLMVDSGKSLVVAELKVIQDDGMLLQGLDYYDYVSTYIESFTRLYKRHSIEIDPTQEVSLFLIAPSFSQTLVNRCKWVDVPVRLFTFTSIKFDNDDDIILVFAEQEIPAQPVLVEVKHIEDHLNYITNPEVRTKAKVFIDELNRSKPGRVSMDAIKYDISMKIDGRVFAYLSPRRQHFVMGTYDADDEWKWYTLRVTRILRTS